MHMIAETMDAGGWTWWADYGTLLGAVRNPLTTWADYPWLPQSDEPIRPGVVPHDKDGDLGALAADHTAVVRALRGAASRARFDMLVRPHGASVKVRLSRFNHTNVDIFFWKERDDGLMHRDRYVHVDLYKGRHFQRDMLFPLGTVQWEDMTLPAPHDPEAFLAHRYGPNWRTPVMANHDGVARD
jgi:hypothetical protein